MVVLGIWAGYSAINSIFSSPRGTAKFEHPYTALIFAEKIRVANLKFNQSHFSVKHSI